MTENASCGRTEEHFRNLQGSLQNNPAANFPRAAVKSEEAGHWLMIDKPYDVARLLLAEG